MNEFKEKFSQEIEKILAKYPSDRKRSAIMPFLHLAQKEDGYIKEQVLSEIGELLDLSSTEVASIVGFYTLYHDKKEGKYRIQVCTDLCCALRGSDEFLEKLCAELDIKPGETTSDGLVSVEAVKCLAACDKAPMLQLQGPDGIAYHEHQNVETTLKLIETWRNEEAA